MTKKQYSTKITSRDHVERKEFNYTRNGVGLNFTLRTDIKQELKDFLELLNEAIKDVSAEITNVGK